MTTPLQIKAAYALKFITRKERDNSIDLYSFDHDSTPEWIKDMCQKAHGGMFPDDHKFMFIYEALCALSEEDDPDNCTMPEEVYNAALSAWLASNLERFGFCDEAMEEFGCEFKDTFTLLSMGYGHEQQEVLRIVRGCLEEMCAEEDPAEDDSRGDFDSFGGFDSYCQQATDSMLEGILEKEFNSTRKEDYHTAKLVAEGRGWVVRKGKRVG